MILRSLIIKDFGPFRGRQVFEFPKASGLYFMWGQNLEQPRLGGNGAGKSKCWEALVWVIFGKTSRGLKAGDAANWDAGKGAAVTLEFGFEPGRPATHFLTRTWSPNSWVLRDLFGKVHDLTKDEVNPFLDALRLDFSQFLHVVLSAQFEPMFLDLKADQKEAMFSQVMELDRWTDYSQKAAKAAGDLDARGRTLERDLATIQGQILEAEAAVDAATQADKWDRDNALEIEDLEARLAKAPRAVKLGDETIAEIEADLAELRDLEVEMKEALRGLKESQHQLEDEEIERRAVVTTLTTLQRVSDQKLDASDLNGDNVCPVCSQPVTEKTLFAHIDELRKEAATLKRKRTLAEHDLDAVKKELATVKSQADRASDSLRDLRDKINEARRDLEDATNLRDRAAAQLDKLKELLEDQRRMKNPHAEASRRNQDRLDDLRSKKASLTRRLDDVLGQWRITLGWVKWFKEIRLEQIAEALVQLEIEVNSAVNDLGLRGWELLFEVDRELKSGSVKRGFHVHVKSPASTKPVPWEAWSGGEGQRLRLSGQQGLGNLIRARRGCPLNLEVWDEPTQGLNELGVTDLLESLKARAEAEDRQIWIVDHRSFGYGGFKGTVKVVKDEKGHSSFTYPDPYI